MNQVYGYSLCRASINLLAVFAFRCFMLLATHRNFVYRLWHIGWSVNICKDCYGVVGHYIRKESFTNSLEKFMGITHYDLLNVTTAAATDTYKISNELSCVMLADFLTDDIAAMHPRFIALLVGVLGYAFCGGVVEFAHHFTPICASHSVAFLWMIAWTVGSFMISCWSGLNSDSTDSLLSDAYYVVFAGSNYGGSLWPHRVVALRVAAHVFQELVFKLGHEVGDSICFEDCTSIKTVITYMSARMLIRECLGQSVPFAMDKDATACWETSVPFRIFVSFSLPKVGLEAEFNSMICLAWSYSGTQWSGSEVLLGAILHHLTQSMVILKLQGMCRGTNGSVQQFSWQLPPESKVTSIYIVHLHGAADLMLCPFSSPDIVAILDGIMKPETHLVCDVAWMLTKCVSSSCISPCSNTNIYATRGVFSLYESEQLRINHLRKGSYVVDELGCIAIWHQEVSNLTSECLNPLAQVNMVYYSQWSDHLTADRVYYSQWSLLVAPVLWRIAWTLLNYTLDYFGVLFS